jgi:molybdopterin converting factor small subunit
LAAEFDVKTTKNGWMGNVTYAVGLYSGAMPVDVKLPTMLRAQADGQATVSVDGDSVGAVFSALVERYPGLRDNLLDRAGGLHRFVNVYKDDDDIRYLEGLDTKVADGDVLSILPAVAGGA